MVKFLSTKDDELLSTKDDEYYEVSQSKWLIKELDENMIGDMLWPEDDSVAANLVRTQADVQSNWSIYTVEVKRYYGKQFFFVF